jgi:hypothetical protein
MSFAIGVCECTLTPGRWGFETDCGPVAFTLNAVGQDNFEDVIVPDAPTEPPKTPNVPAADIIR